MRRIYVPATIADLQALHATGMLTTANSTSDGVEALAVTQVLRAALGHDSDEEELEDAAMLDAAEHSLGLLADVLTPSSPHSLSRRLVVVCDVNEGIVAETPEQGPTAVFVSGPVRLADVACVLCDESAAMADVRSAAAALQSHGWEDDTAMRLVEAVEQHALLWWATQETSELLGTRDDDDSSGR